MLVYGHIAGVDVPFPLDNPDACKDSNITCPIKNNQAYGYRNAIFVKTSYPSVSYFSWWLLKRHGFSRLAYKAHFALMLPIQARFVSELLSDTVDDDDDDDDDERVCFNVA